MKEFEKAEFALNNLAQKIHEWTVRNGFYEPDKIRGFDGMLANVHSEASEALEEWRNGRQPDETYFLDAKGPQGVPSELADIIIRVLDICAFFKIDIEEAIAMKMSYNLTRPYRNGGKMS